VVAARSVGRNPGPAPREARGRRDGRRRATMSSDSGGLSVVGSMAARYATLSVHGGLGGLPPAWTAGKLGVVVRGLRMLGQADPIIPDRLYGHWFPMWSRGRCACWIPLAGGFSMVASLDSLAPALAVLNRRGLVLR